MVTPGNSCKRGSFSCAEVSVSTRSLISSLAWDDGVLEARVMARKVILNCHLSSSLELRTPNYLEDNKGAMISQSKFRVLLGRGKYMRQP